MATQPFPTIGSITYLVHLIVILVHSLRKVNKIILFLPLVIFAIFIFSKYYVLQQKKNNYFYSPISENLVDNKHKNEKTESITDISFIKDQHFAAWIPWWDEERVIKSLKLIPKGYIESISPIWYNLSSNGEIKSNPGTILRSNILATALDSNISVIPTINNEANLNFDGKRVTQFLNNKKLQLEFIIKAIELAKENGYTSFYGNNKEGVLGDKGTPEEQAKLQELNNILLIKSKELQKKIEVQ